LVLGVANSTTLAWFGYNQDRFVSGDGRMTSPSKSIFDDRHNKLFAELRKMGLDALVLNPGPSLFYLTGLRFHLSERPVVAIFSPEATAVMVLPELEAGKIQDLPFPVRAFPYGEDPLSWQAAFRQAVQAAEMDGRPTGLEPRQMRVLEEGMIFTIEPGVYLPGRGGVRIEDDFLITHDAGESLSNLPRDLIII
jgi:Xaa-Pro aminopeptidase